MIANFYEVTKVDKEGGGYAWKPVENGPVVRAPLIDSNLDVVLNWQSPFEQSGPESKLPTLLAMSQSGTLLPFIDSIIGSSQDKSADGKGKPSSAWDNFLQDSKEFMKKFGGKTGITKLNSTQVFTGMQPSKIQLTALFRAWKNAADEVMTPFNQLMTWALPRHLGADGSMLARLIDLKNQGRPTTEKFINAFLPSDAPTQIALWYKGRTYSPLVIELISEPMNSPIDSSGNYVELAVPMTLGTLTAWDGKDWAATPGAGPSP